MYIHTFSFSDKFEWDPDKRLENLNKHNIDFRRAIRIFDDPVAVKKSNQKGETRQIAVGILNHMEIAVVFTMRGENCRIISARRARNYERREYRDLYTGGTGQTSR